MKILFLIPDLNKPGGVANYYKAIRSSLPDTVQYFTRGTRKNGGRIRNAFNFFADYLRFAGRVLLFDKVLVNTSFARSGIMRDAGFCLLCRLFRRPYIVFFRGWEKAFEQPVSSGFYRFIFKISFLRAEKAIVLSSDFAAFIKNCGYARKVVVETTIVEQSLFAHEDIEQVVRERKQTIPRMLFLSRLEKNKGIFECIEIHQQLRRLGFENELLIAGSGSADEVINAISDPGIVRLGYVSGESKAEAYRKAHFYLFPSTHGEGMPNSVLEAMMFGLPVLTTRMGGIRDFFTEEMGISTEQPDVERYIAYIVRVLKEEIDPHQVAITNHNYAAANFSQDVVAARLMKEINGE